jgi:hypothetical protein
MDEAIEAAVDDIVVVVGVVLAAARVPADAEAAGTMARARSAARRMAAERRRADADGRRWGVASIMSLSGVGALVHQEPNRRSRSVSL